MYSGGTWSDEQAGQPGYVNTTANPFRQAKDHPPHHQKTPPRTIVVGNKRDTFIWSPFTRDSRPQAPPRSPLGCCGVSGIMEGPETASQPSISSKCSSLSTPTQSDTFPVSALDDTPNSHFTDSTWLPPPINGTVQDAAALFSHSASQSERPSTRENKATTVLCPSCTPNIKPDLLSPDLATTRALLTSSEETILALQERIDQLESAQVPRKHPRDRQGRFITTVRVRKAQRRPGSSDRARRRTQIELLVEAAIMWEYVDVANVNAVAGKSVAGRLREVYARGRRHVEDNEEEEEEDREKTWVRSWCEGVWKRGAAEIQGTKGTGVRSEEDGAVLVLREEG
ncbi:hypothetical protein N0V93_006634 [Gnomoniopsis smithogilvyi]|uniref:Uncharacterized protein n=1 Tax=Gnomoniopsis smithogilvyi TaxID=1191159 RepID=A0A9W8YR44_9PEZI|nr:hypothetical protein N0V93_006634 [Gnomoniopsis smithogilvyi]